MTEEQCPACLEYEKEIDRLTEDLRLSEKASNEHETEEIRLRRHLEEIKWQIKDSGV